MFGDKIIKNLLLFHNANINMAIHDNGNVILRSLVFDLISNYYYSSMTKFKFGDQVVDEIINSSTTDLLPFNARDFNEDAVTIDNVPLIIDHS